MQKFTQKLSRSIWFGCFALGYVSFCVTGLIDDIGSVTGAYDQPIPVWSRYAAACLTILSMRCGLWLDELKLQQNLTRSELWRLTFRN